MKGVEIRERLKQTAWLGWEQEITKVEDGELKTQLEQLHYQIT